MFQNIYKKYIIEYKILILSITIIIVGSLGFFLISNYTTQINNQKSQQKIASTVVNVKQTPTEPKKVTYYYVDIKGAVVNPNVYQVTEDTRVIDVIKLAGGLTAQADTRVLNLSKKVSDEMMIIIYTKAEITKFEKNSQSREQIIQQSANTCNCPDPNINGACANTLTSNNANSTKVSLNNATKEQLMTLSNIGETKAQAIIDYRTNNGSFKIIEDLKNVTGIGDSTFDKIKDYITL